MMRLAVLLACGVHVVMAAASCTKDNAPSAGDEQLASSTGGVAASVVPVAGAGGSRNAPTAGVNGARPAAGGPSVPRVGTGDVDPSPATSAAGSGSDAPAPGGAGGAGGAVAAAGSGATPGMTMAECPAVPSGMEPGTARAVTIDAQNIIGTIRSLQGAHWDPGAASGGLSQNYVEMGVDLIRTHDAGGINGTGAGDVDGPGRSRMFPNMSADSASEASYNFGPTDSLLKNITDAGAEILFRVGRSNISGGNTVPEDFDKYADVVKHIVMHYNQGWANGFKYGIRYWEIWNEPDFIPFWLGTGEQYHELYGKIAMAIRSVEPTALIGGPANSTFNDKMKTRGSLMKYIQDNQLPLDFYSYHKYTNKSQDPMDFARMAQSFRDELDMHGFPDAQIINSEWETSLQGDVMLGGEAGRAAFTADALIYMQNGPVAKSTSYMRIGANQSKESFAFTAISKLNASSNRVCAQGGDDNGFGVLAGISQTEPLLQVVIANYQIAQSLMGPIPGGNDEVLQFPGIGKLADMTYPERRSFTYPDKDGYDLTIRSIPEAWGDVTVTQRRIDARNDFDVVETKTVTVADRAQGLKISGKWARAQQSADDPTGAAQGVDLIVVSGASVTSSL